MGQFADALQKFADKTMMRADMVTKTVILDMAAKIEERSPVGNPALWKHPAPPGYRPGWFQNNWQLGIDSPAAGPVERFSGGAAAVVASIPERAIGHVIYLTNNVPYGPRLEYDAWSSQAPQGMVGITVEEFPAIVNEAIANVTAGGL